jgi:putative transposase
LKLSERHIIKKTDKRWKICDELCFKSKNLYNQALYRIKQEFIKNKKFKRYRYIDKEMIIENQVDYRAIQSSAQQILMLLDKNIECYFKALRAWKRDKSKFLGCPKFPKYKDKIKGRNVVLLSWGGFSVKNNMIRFPKKLNLPNLKTKIVENKKHNEKTIKQIRIIPATNCYVIEVIYNKEIEFQDLDESKYLSIDLGVNNLMTVITNNQALKPFIINGKIVKSINQYYNKQLSKLQSKLIRNHLRYTSNRINRLIYKRNNKITDYFHKSSKYIIDYCIDNKIGNIVIGKNDGWKNEINIGKVNNQKMTYIPFNKLIHMISYKAALNDINVILTEESYTSKIDHLAFEEMKHHNIYKGKRIKRGLFQSSVGTKLNADINGSIGILRKVIQNEFLLDRGLAFNPIKVYKTL